MDLNDIPPPAEVPTQIQTVPQSTADPPERRPPPNVRPSSPIPTGSDALVLLLASEKEKQQKVYVASLQKLEAKYEFTREEARHTIETAQAEVKRVKAEAEAQVATLQNDLLHEAVMKRDLERELRHMKDREAKVRHQLGAVRGDNACLRAALAAIGVEYVPPSGAGITNASYGGYTVQLGQLRFDTCTARVVHEFIKGAREQEEWVRNMTSSAPMADVGITTTSIEALLSRPVGPAQFFDVLDAVLRKGREYAKIIAQSQLPTPGNCV